jgi:AcrR family transcriptional regulator
MPAVSLRERKKARTRASLREHALRLFREQGYQRTTVEQIAAAAEVSPSTFFRYFPTKEDLVLQDDMDTRLVEAFERQPPGLSPIAALRGAIREGLGSYNQSDLDIVRETTNLTMTVPEVRARAMDEFARTIAVISEAVAKRAGRPADDLAVRTLAGSSASSCPSPCRGRAGPTRRPSWTCSSASTRPLTCWRPASRSEQACRFSAASARLQGGCP